LLQVGVGVLAPIAELERAPVPNAVAVVSLTAVAAAGGKVELPTGAMRLVITLTVRSLLLLPTYYGSVIAKRMCYW
jgi:hypothetical protein